MKHNGLSPEAGPVIVTGATGGVGSLAVDMLAGRGYEVVALTGKEGERGYLEDLGASEVLLRQELEMGGRPLESARWAGAVDTVGGETLGWLTRTAKCGCGEDVSLASRREKPHSRVLREPEVNEDLSLGFP
jgi:acrylyl-CoA reductase (NADPH)